MLADASIVIWVAVGFLVGIIGFVVMLLALVWRGLRALFAALFGEPQKPRKAGAARADQRQQVCPHPRCGHLSRRADLYCARCGRPLSRAYELDAYG